jgi:chaperonin GroES
MTAVEAYQDDAEQAIDPQAFFAAVTESPNLAEELADDKLAEIAQQCVSDYEMDKNSMSEWFESMERGLELARLVKKQKDYPFKGAANIKYPLLTSAALQFNARAYPAIVPSDRVVKAKVWGADKQGLKAARAERISEHMSWQLHAQVSEWEEETDKLLVQLPIVGTMVRKWWYDPIEARPRCRTVQPGRFIVNDHVKVLDEAPRCTEEISLYPTEIEERKRLGQFLEDFEPDTTGEDEMGPQEFIEQHTRLDLDEDDYPEPYVVTVHLAQRKVVRIVADFSQEDVRFDTEQRAVPVEMPVVVQDPMTGQTFQQMQMQMQQQEVVTGVASIRRGTYFVAHQFLPAMDGGFWGTGLGILLGDISDTINGILNQMMDASHYAALPGGFIGSEFRIKGGSQRMRPGEWKMVEATGQDVRSAMVQMQFKGADATMFQLLGMLIEAGREIASVKDVVTGDGQSLGKNASPTTTLAMIEQGMMVFTAAYKRIFRACASEYRMLARINRDTVDPEQYMAFHDDVDENGQPIQLDPRADYGEADMDVQPVADPRSVTKMQQAAKAQMVMDMAMNGFFDKGEAASRVAEAMDIPGVESLIPQPDEMQMAQVQMQMQMAQAELAEKSAKIELTLAQVEETKTQAMENIASAQTDQVRAANEMTKTRMEALKAVLEDERTRLGELLRAGAGMARASGNGNTARTYQQPNTGPQIIPSEQMVGGTGNF